MTQQTELPSDNPIRPGGPPGSVVPPKLDANREEVANDATADGNTTGGTTWNRAAAIAAWTQPETQLPATGNAGGDTAVATEAPRTPQPLEVKAYQFKILEQAINVADSASETRELNRLVEGHNNSISLIEESLKPGSTPQDKAAVGKLLAAIELQKENHYLAYLSPANARADLAFAKIATGDAKLVEEGERGLVEVVKSRPALQFDPDFQKQLEKSYENMAAARKKANLPPLAVPDAAPVVAQTGFEKTNPYEIMAEARRIAEEKGIQDAIPKFNEARLAAEGGDSTKLEAARLGAFSQRLALTRHKAELDLDGKDSDVDKSAIDELRKEEWANYKLYLAPGLIGTNAAFAMIASGDPKTMNEGKAVLADAIFKRPEIEFSEDYKKHVQSALEAGQQSLTEQSAAGDTTTTGSTTEKAANQALKPLEPSYKPIGQMGGKVPELENDPEIQGYFVDKATGPVLTAGLLYLGYRQVKHLNAKRLERIRTREAASGDTSTDTKSGTTESKGNGGEVKTTGPEAETKTRQGDAPRQPVRPPRETLGGARNFVRTEVQTAGDGTQKILEGSAALEGLTWKQKLTDPEVKELDTRRLSLEERVKRGETLAEAESKDLSRLRYFDQNRFNPKVHQQIIEHMGSARPEGGFNEATMAGGRFRFGNVSAPIIGASLLLIALGETVAHAEETKTPSTPAPHSKFKQE